MPAWSYKVFDKVQCGDRVEIGVRFDDGTVSTEERFLIDGSQEQFDDAVATWIKKRDAVPEKDDIVIGLVATAADVAAILAPDISLVKGGVPVKEIPEPEPFQPSAAWWTSFCRLEALQRIERAGLPGIDFSKEIVAAQDLLAQAFDLSFVEMP